MLHVVEIDADTDTSMEAVREYQIYPSIAESAPVFRTIREHYSNATPPGAGGKLNIVGSRIHESTASDKEGAIADVRSGTALLINDAAIDLIPATRSKT